MADIQYSQDAGSYNLATGGGQFSTPGYNSPDWQGFFDAAANRKAQAAAEEKRRYEIELKMKQDAIHRQNMQQNLEERRTQLAANTAPHQDWVDVPAMKTLAFGTNSANTRVPVNSPAADSTILGVRGY